MTGSSHKPETAHWMDRFATAVARASSERFGRRSLASAGVITVAGAASAEHPARPAGAIQSDTSADVLGIAATVEGLLVTLLGVARTRATDMTLDESTIRLIRAAQCEEEAHYNNLVSVGGSPATGSYTIRDQVFEDPTSFLTTWLDLERIMVGMYMAAVRQLAASGDLELVEIAYQIGVVDAQHQALIRQLAGERLPADRAFAAWQYGDVAEALDEIGNMGFIDGRGTSYDYPGPGDRYCRGITGLVAETTADQTPPDVTPAPPQDTEPDGEQPQASPVSDS